MFVDDYLDALGNGDQEKVLALFAEDAVVHSPLYGPMLATDFYPALFADTAESRLHLKCVLNGEMDGSTVVAFWFDFDWILADGTPAPFTVMDVARLDDTGLITSLDIVYDTVSVRPLFEQSSAA